MICMRNEMRNDFEQQKPDCRSAALTGQINQFYAASPRWTNASTQKPQPIVYSRGLKDRTTSIASSALVIWRGHVHKSPKRLAR